VLRCCCTRLGGRWGLQAVLNDAGFRVKHGMTELVQSHLYKIAASKSDKARMAK
jgi:hypothetical protein